MTDFLKKINWLDHDGVYLSMINDYGRNAFYQNALAESVKGKHCLEIGFGTGLLSIMAIEQGAKSVTAYESDDTRYLLGLKVIQTLGLEKKINLIHSRFNHLMYKNHPEIDIVYSETLSSDFWGEGFTHSLPRSPGINLLPEDYELEIHAQIVSPEFAKGLNSPKTEFNRFAPGITINPVFVNFINDCINTTYDQPTYSEDTTPLSTGIIPVHPNLQTEWGWHTYLETIIHHPNPVARYIARPNSCSIEQHDSRGSSTIPFNFDTLDHSLIIDTSKWRDKIVLLVPRFILTHKTHKHYLDMGEAWGPAKPVVLLVNPKTDVMAITEFQSQGLRFEFVQ